MVIHGDLNFIILQGFPLETYLDLKSVATFRAPHKLACSEMSSRACLHSKDELFPPDGLSVGAPPEE